MFSNVTMSQIAIFTGIMAFISIAGVLRSRRIRKDGVPAAAVVTKIEPSTGSHSRRYDNVFLTFRDAGGQEITARTDGARGQYTVGQALEIVYMRDRPTKIYPFAPTLSTYALFYVLAAVGVVLMVLRGLRVI